MRAPVWFAVGVCGAGLVATGCDWRDFDNLQAGTPVLVVSPPSGYSAPSDFGRVVLPLTPPTDGSAAARYLGSAIDQTGLALVQIDAKGQASSQNVTSAALDNLNGAAVTAMAQAIGGGQVLLGVPTVDGGSLLTLDLTSLVVTPFFAASTEPQFGMGVAVGNLQGLGANDLVAVSGSAVHVFVGTSNHLVVIDSPLCPLAVSASLPSVQRINRAVVIGALMSGGLQIAVGTPVMSGGGSVSLIALDATASTLTCTTLSAPLAADSRFGQALAIGDFDGDGNADLLVGAPPSRAYLYRGPLAAGALPAATITDATTGGDFGAALAALNLDGKGGDEALIGDPDATVGGQAQAGSVAIFTGATLGTPLMPVLSDHAPSGGEVYGSAVAALPFCAASPCPAKPPLLPLVGAASQVFTYFAISGQTDPRAK